MMSNSLLVNNALPDRLPEGKNNGKILYFFFVTKKAKNAKGGTILK